MNYRVHSFLVNRQGACLFSCQAPRLHVYIRLVVEVVILMYTPTRLVSLDDTYIHNHICIRMFGLLKYNNTYGSTLFTKPKKKGKGEFNAPIFPPCFGAFWRGKY